MAKKRKRKPLHQHLRHWFVPHRHNDHRPHLIRAHGLAVMAVLIIGIQFTANMWRPAAVRVPGSQVLAYATDITPVAILNLTNQQRAANGLPALRLEAKLNQSASLKSQNMFSENYWAHVSPSGIQPWYWFQQAGYNYTYAGENLAKDFDTSAGTVQGWMNSPGHRANILNANYTDIGISVQNGTLTGGQTTLVVAHYGATAGTAVAATVPAATPKPAAPKPVVAAAVTTPVPTAAPVPSPAPTAAPTATPTTVPVVAAANPATPNAPSPQNYGLFKPLSLVHTLNPGTLATLLLLLVLLIVYAATHITVWRRGLRRWSSLHYRVTAAAQLSGLSAAIVLLAISGFGSVG
jgi:hypothetical protein